MIHAKTLWLTTTLAGVLILVAAGVHAQQVVRRLPVVPPAVAPTVPVGTAVSGAAIVDKLLRPGPSDPEVPLPRSDLAGASPRYGTLDRPQIFGRREDGGGVFGVRIPFPAARNPGVGNTRYGTDTRGVGSP